MKIRCIRIEKVEPLANTQDKPILRVEVFPYDNPLTEAKKDICHGYVKSWHWNELENIPAEFFSKLSESLTQILRGDLDEKKPVNRPESSE